jgi:hypothetical protein
MQIDIKEEEKISGVLSSLYWFLSRTDHQLINVERVTLDSHGKLISRDKEDGLDGVNKPFDAGNGTQTIAETFDMSKGLEKRVTLDSHGKLISRDKEDGLDGVRFHFVKKGEKDIKRLTYFSCDISDDGFEEDNPELLIYLNNMRECNTFVKSASYLMHYRSFKNIRNVVLDKSLSIFQDDTGLPYKYVNNDDWNIRCFGSYVKPIKDFEKNYEIIYQYDLAKRYKEDTEKLPFSLGYHWRDASEQNQMLMIKQD